MASQRFERRPGGGGKREEREDRSGVEMRDEFEKVSQRVKR